MIELARSIRGAPPKLPAMPAILKPGPVPAALPASDWRISLLPQSLLLCFVCSLLPSSLLAGGSLLATTIATVFTRLPFLPFSCPPHHFSVSSFLSLRLRWPFAVHRHHRAPCPFPTPPHLVFASVQVALTCHDCRVQPRSAPSRHACCANSP